MSDEVWEFETRIGVDLCIGYRTHAKPKRYAFFGSLHYDVDKLKEPCSYCENEYGEVCEVCGPFALEARDYRYNYPAFERVSGGVDTVTERIRDYWCMFDEWVENKYVRSPALAAPPLAEIRIGTRYRRPVTRSIIIGRGRQRWKGFAKLFILGTEILSDPDFAALKEHLTDPDAPWTETVAPASRRWPVEFSAKFKRNAAHDPLR